MTALVQKELLLLPVSHEKDYSRKILLSSAMMDEASTRAFIKANFGMMNADINDALLTAVSMSYAAMTGDSSVSVQLEGHGREVLSLRSWRHRRARRCR